MKALDWAFGEAVLQRAGVFENLEDSFNAVYDFTRSGTVTISSGSTPEEQYHEKLALDSAPFMYTKSIGLNYHELPREDDTKLIFQALFLLVLREQVPHKCKYFIQYHNLFLVFYFSFCAQFLQRKVSRRNFLTLTTDL